MSFSSPLRIDGTLLPSQEVPSFSLMQHGLFALTTVGTFQLQGEGLHHCVIDLLNGLCDGIQPIMPPTPLLPLQWQVNTITPIKRMHFSRAAPVNPFEGIVPEGWILFEQLNGWHHWPIKTLLAIAQTRTALLFVYVTMTVTVEAPLPALQAEFDRWAAGGINARHYTERNFSDYSGLLPVKRFAATDIHLRQCNPQQGLRDKQIEQWLSFSSALTKPPERKTWEIGR